MITDTSLFQKYVKQIADGGTKVNLGSHGQIQGIGAHWELWMLAQGGMTPLQAMRCATLNGASYLGMDKEIGSLETGKLADLIVLNQNPLEDIRNSEFIKYVMVNGRLYDADSMNEIGNREKPRIPFWWQQNRGEMSNPTIGKTENLPVQRTGRRLSYLEVGFTYFCHFIKHFIVTYQTVRIFCFLELKTLYL